MRPALGMGLSFVIATAPTAIAFAANEDYKHASVRAEMRAMDANRDGKISIAEYADCAQQAFQSLDGNQDNRVTAPEMDEAQKPMKAVDVSHGEQSTQVARELSFAEKIKPIDTDHDGVLTAQEYATGANTLFANMDTNKDGYLTVDEISARHEEIAAEDR